MSAIELYPRPSGDFAAKVQASVALLQQLGQAHGRITQASSLGAEDMVLTHLVHLSGIRSGVFVLDTGHLHAETLAMIPKIERRYATSVRVFRPRHESVVHFVRLDNRSRYDDTFLLSRIDIAPGQPLDTERLQRNLLELYGLETMDQVSYDLVEENGQTGVVVTVVPHRHGPNYLETGLSLYSDFSGDFFVNLRAGVLRAPVTRLGGELRGLLQLGDEPGLLMDYYQPLGVEGDYFFTTA